MHPETELWAMKKRPTKQGRSEAAEQLARTFGATVRRLRETKGVSQEEFAYQCGLHRTYMGLIERGEHVASIYTVQRIAQGLNMTMYDLFKNVEECEG